MHLCTQLNIVSYNKPNVFNYVVAVIFIQQCKLKQLPESSFQNSASVSSLDRNFSLGYCITLTSLPNAYSIRTSFFFQITANECQNKILSLALSVVNIPFATAGYFCFCLVLICMVSSGIGFSNLTTEVFMIIF